MALIFMDTWQHYAIPNVAALTGAKWTGEWTGTSVTAVSHTDYGRVFGQPGLLLNGTAGRGVYKTIAPGGTDFFMGGWFYFNALPGTNAILAVGEGTTEHVSLRGNGSGNLTLTRNGTVLGTSSSTVTISVWYWIEVRVRVHDSTGQAELRVDGTNTGWLNLSGVDTRNAGAGTITSLGLIIPANAGYRQGGVFCADDTGSAANTWAGPSTFHVRRPDEAGNYAQWTANFGPNFSNVSDFIPDEDTTFNQSSTSSQKDTFKGDDLPVSSGTVYAIQHVIRARQDGGAARTVRPITRISSTDYNGTSYNTSGSYAYNLQPVSVSPATSSAWTISEINGAEFGYELVS